MSADVLQQLSDAQTALITALDLQNIDAIDAANAAVAVAVEEMRVVGGWKAWPGLQEDLIRTLRDAEAARGHINSLADKNRRNFDKLVSLGGAPRAGAYSRSGKLA